MGLSMGTKLIVPNQYPEGHAPGSMDCKTICGVKFEVPLVL